MPGVNRVTLLGRMCGDPEIRNFQSGGRVVNFRVATSETWKDQGGERKERTQFHSVAIFNEKLGEIAEKYLRKGDQVYLEGQLENRKWQDQAGQDRYSTEVVLRPYHGEICLIRGSGGAHDGEGGGREDRGGGSQRGGERRERGAGSGDRRGGSSGGGWDSRTGARSRPADMDDDIPFSPPWQ